MGIFWERSDQATIPDFGGLINESFHGEQPSEAEVAAHARGWAQGTSAMQGSASLNVSRLLAALGIVAVLLAAGIATDAAHMADSSKALFALATTAFGIVVGLISGEKSGTS